MRAVDGRTGRFDADVNAEEDEEDAADATDDEKVDEEERVLAVEGRFRKRFERWVLPPTVCVLPSLTSFGKANLGVRGVGVCSVVYTEEEPTDEGLELRLCRAFLPFFLKDGWVPPLKLPSLLLVLVLLLM